MHACLTEEINLLYKIDPKLTAKGKAMSIERLQKRENRRNLKQVNYQLLTEISNATKAKWFTDLKTLRDEEAVHGAISGKDWQATLGGCSPTIKLGMKGVSDFAAWCSDILKETSKFLERCYQQM